MEISIKKEKKTKNSIAKEAILLTIGKIIVVGISLLNSMLLSRFRTLHEYGTYSQITTIVSIVSTIFVLGLPNCLNYFIGKADTNEEKDKFLCTYYKMISVLSLSCGIVLVACIGLIVFYYNNTSIYDYWYCLLILPWTTTVIEGFSNMMVSYKKTTKLIFFNLFRSIGLLLIIFFTKFLNGSFSTYMIIYILFDSIFTCLVYLQAAKLTTKFYKAFDTQMIKAILIFSIPMGISSLLSTLNIKMDHLVVGTFFSTDEYAIFSNAATELPFNVISASFTAVLMPKMVKLLKNNDEKKAILLWKDVIKFNSIIMFFFSIVCVVFAPYIMKILYSDKYIPGYSVFRVYSFILLLRITYFGMILNSKGRPKFILLSSLIALLLNLFLNILFVHLFGMIGPAISTLLSLLIVGILQLSISCKIIKIRFRDIFPWKFLIGMLFLHFSFSIILLRILEILELDFSNTSTFYAILIGVSFLLIYFGFWGNPMKKILQRMKEF